MRPIEADAGGGAMTVKERMFRNSPEDQIEIGSIVERALKGDFGTILKLVANGMIEEDLNASRIAGGLPAE